MKIFARFLLILSAVTFGFAGSVSAQVTAYKIRDAGTLPAPTVGGVGRVIEFGIIPVDYKGERIILSKNPDGTGEARVGDTFQLTFQRSTGGSSQFTFNASSVSCNPQQKKLLPPTDVTDYFISPVHHSVTYRYIDWCGGSKPVDSLYLVAIPQNPQPTPTNTPSPMPTIIPTSTPVPTVTSGPTPAGPVPFLRLPWNYEKYGLSFGEAALRMSSYFDHEFPFLSAAISEPDGTKQTVITFKNRERTQDSYTSHDGYDYAYGAGARLGEPVLAAAAGRAMYLNSCAACGNAILIDHGNHFQTRYYHLSKNGLILSDPNKSAIVLEGQQIGTVGATGNVIPAGDRGAHIHFMVVEDKNRDGSFDDNIPDGVTDPYGWHLAQQDPWPNHTFFYNNELRKGNKSNYLWKDSLDKTARAIESEGGAVSIPHTTFTFDPDSYPEAFTFTVSRSTPVTYGDTLASVGNTIIAQAVAGVDTFVTQFNKFFTLEIDFSKEDLSVFKPDSLSIYSSIDGTTWVKENTIVDLTNKKAAAKVNHLSHFALMGERIDTTAPVINAVLKGSEGIYKRYRSEVVVNLTADNEQAVGASGIDYIFYRLDGGEWQQYLNSVQVRLEGDHVMEFYGVDNAGNIGTISSTVFTIDLTPPEAWFVFDPSGLYMRIGSNENSVKIVKSASSRRDQTEQIQLNDEAGNTLIITAKDREKGTLARVKILSLQYNDDEIIQVPPAELAVSYKLRVTDPQLRVFDQILKIKDEVKLSLLYSAKTDKTKVVIKEKGKDKQKEVFDGIRNLKVYTDRGTVKYEY